METPENTGPRHLTKHPSKPIVYVANEQGSGVTAYDPEPKAGALSPRQTLSTLPQEWQGVNACAEIKVHPSGRFKYVSNRSHDSIAGFALYDDGPSMSLEFRLRSGLVHID
jgi:6-phosphogluconolactonase